MHWVTKPDTSQPEEVRISAAAAKELQAIPGVRNFGSHIGQAFLADEVVRHLLRRELDQHRRGRRLRRDARQGPRGGRRLSRAPPRRADVSQGANPRGAHRIERGDRRPHLRRRPRHAAQTRPTRSKEMLGKIDGVVEANVELQSDVPQVEVKVDLAEAAGVRPQAGRRPPCGRDARRGRGGRRHLPRRQGLRRPRVEHARDAQQPDRDPRACRSTRPDGGSCALDDVADVRIAAAPNPIHRQDGSRTIEVGANVRGRDLGSVAEDDRAAARRK